MQAHYKQLFLYHHYTQKALYDYLSDHLSIIPAQAIKLFFHITNAHQIWNARILRQQEFHVWQEHEWEQVLTIQEQNLTTSISIIESVELGSLVHYQNSKGIMFQNTVGDILFHMINHSTYHRGQIAMVLRQSNILPLPTDYIIYKRGLC